MGFLGIQHFDIETLIKREEKCGRLSPTVVDVDNLFEVQGRRIPRLRNGDICTPLTTHHDVRDLQSMKNFWIIGLPGFFTGALSQAKLLLLLNLRSSFFMFHFLIFAFQIQTLLYLSTLFGVIHSLPGVCDVGHFVVIQFPFSNRGGRI